jgi:hypothetical protein
LSPNFSSLNKIGLPSAKKYLIKIGHIGHLVLDVYEENGSKNRYKIFMLKIGLEEVA